jgi:hypothetical protein
LFLRLVIGKIIFYFYFSLAKFFFNKKFHRTVLFFWVLTKMIFQKLSEIWKTQVSRFSTATLFLIIFEGGTRILNNI